MDAILLLIRLGGDGSSEEKEAMSAIVYILCSAPLLIITPPNRQSTRQHKNNLQLQSLPSVCPIIIWARLAYKVLQSVAQVEEPEEVGWLLNVYSRVNSCTQVTMT